MLGVATGTSSAHRESGNSNCCGTEPEDDEMATDKPKMRL